MYDFHYNYIKPKYSKNVQLNYMDTDSFIYMSGAETFAGLLLAYCCRCAVSRGQRLLRSDIKSKVKLASFCRLLLTHVKSTNVIQLLIPFFSLSLSIAIPFWSFSLSESLTMTAPHSAETTLSIVLNPRSQQLCK